MVGAVVVVLLVGKDLMREAMVVTEGQILEELLPVVEVLEAILEVLAAMVLMVIMDWGEQMGRKEMPQI